MKIGRVAVENQIRKDRRKDRQRQPRAPIGLPIPHPPSADHKTHFETVCFRHWQKKLKIVKTIFLDFSKFSLFGIFFEIKLKKKLAKKSENLLAKNE